MSLKTAEQYEESLRRLNLKVYLLGERIDNPVDHPMIRPSMNSVKMTYALAEDPLHEDLMTATFPPYGKKDQSLLSSASEHGRSHQKGQNAAAAGTKDGRLLPAVRGNGRH